MENEEFLSLDSSSRDVDSYSDALLVLYAKQAAEAINMHRWKAERVTTYKDYTRTSLHEYLVIQLQNSETDKDIHLKLERRLRDPDPEDARPFITNLVSSVSDHRAAQIVSGDKRAIDGISIIRLQDLSARQIVVDQASWHPEGQISLPQLIILACTISRLVHSKYNLITNNCYWFAQAVVEAVRVIYPNFENSEEVQANMRGCWNYVPIHEKVDAENITKEFENDWGMFLRHIQGVKDSLLAREHHKKKLEQHVKELETLVSARL